MTVFIAGASRGIGREFARQYRADGERVVATARDEAGLQALRELGCEAHRLDVTDAASVAGLGWRADGERVDIAILNAGVYGPHTDGLQAPSQEDFDLVMRTNVLGPMRLLQALQELLAPGARVVVLSSVMGSIGQRSGAAGWLYRASKAALNSVLKDASTVLGARGATCVAVHPGWVRTDMGGPGAALPVEHSVGDLRRLIARLGPEDNGRFYAHGGTPIPW
ncbi:SDR family oxidoreductase [Caldimonas thermodepolymerans]|uniref:NAD(P)-dependent dehydrogenase (Short-subunit alcohol dehydrogenase family) n=1 Tax=Caldimonas thermodepolymerans TaxID=215580 RepID=A0A2S5T260_9BURK|nr:SDR family oxidoreductase [Caldimonas thermodepolymerans]PPE69063.1 short chain dehydrogenase [Caldimonas thermodepolymerans]QPC32114.1 SDR family oxidoreductase [Caldimonas thermodepolymerans]RDH95869.1 NAD(P)-dependent dehydrogenase (short-subunit alcohol dehydrogenase family) [Caldimonas thermodepolymerans]TCP08232.1 NAD(P)-dependent dehydrogenase (short-subunit alcohol dehydrogenase family) [Caldimonas thermodepolymerans]UZG44911.1 SDR family oxidoreductase [Caldimonas thermodepolymeran